MENEKKLANEQSEKVTGGADVYAGGVVGSLGSLDLTLKDTINVIAPPVGEKGFIGGIVGGVGSLDLTLKDTINVIDPTIDKNSAGGAIVGGGIFPVR